MRNGWRSSNGGNANKLHDGQIPGEEDEPSENFFFAAGTEGGRLLVDLGGTIDIQQVNTYSWHSADRGPQVHKLYASEGNAEKFDARPKRGTDPEGCGWKLVARVDTRPKDGTAGGQYGVSISDSSGTLGTYRYLLFDVSRTEPTDPFGSTFHGEIDVVDPKSPIVAATTYTPPEAITVEAEGESTASRSTLPKRQTLRSGRPESWGRSSRSGIRRSSSCCPATATKPRGRSASRSAGPCEAWRRQAEPASGAEQVGTGGT